MNAVFNKIVHMKPSPMVNKEVTAEMVENKFDLITDLKDLR